MLQTHNTTIDPTFVSLFDNRGVSIWTDPAVQKRKVMTPALMKSISCNIGVGFRGAPKKDCDGLVEALAKTAQTSMEKDGFTFGVSGIVVEKPAKGKGKGSSKTLSFPSVLTARAFYYKFNEYEWASNTGSHAYIITLRHAVFEEECKQVHVRRGIQGSAPITPALLQKICSTPLVHAPPGLEALAVSRPAIATNS